MLFCGGIPSSPCWCQERVLPRGLSPTCHGVAVKARPVVRGIRPRVLLFMGNYLATALVAVVAVANGTVCDTEAWVDAMS